MTDDGIPVGMRDQYATILEARKAFGLPRVGFAVKVSSTCSSLSDIDGTLVAITWNGAQPVAITVTREVGATDSRETLIPWHAVAAVTYFPQAFGPVRHPEAY